MPWDLRSWVSWRPLEKRGKAQSITTGKCCFIRSIDSKMTRLCSCMQFKHLCKESTCVLLTATDQCYFLIIFNLQRLLDPLPTLGALQVVKSNHSRQCKIIERWRLHGLADAQEEGQEVGRKAGRHLVLWMLLPLNGMKDYVNLFPGFKWLLCSWIKNQTNKKCNLKQIFTNTLFMIRVLLFWKMC